MAEPGSGDARPTRDCLSGLLDDLADVATQLGCSEWLERARGLIVTNGAIAQRRVAAGDQGRAGARRAAAWLAERFLDPPSG